jgi:hypothetical protein
MENSPSTSRAMRPNDEDGPAMFERLSGAASAVVGLEDHIARETGDQGMASAELAIAIQRMRRVREELFPGLFADPAWDILLDLYIAGSKRLRVSVSNACIGAAVPVSTALRHIDLMVGKGLIVRSPDTLDGRRVFLSLSDEADALMGTLLQTSRAMLA